MIYKKISFRVYKKVVWNKAYIKNALLEMSDNKCCYCECKIGKGEREMHVEHFKPKSIYPDLVVEWNNLLPSCPHCNKQKSSHDTGNDSEQVIKELVEERYRQKKTQQEMADITGVRASNIARFERASCMPTLIMLEKYANALGKHIEIRICEDEE